MFWISFGTSQFSQNLVPYTPYLSPKHFNNHEENPQTSSTNIIFAYLDFQHFVNFGKDGHREIPKNRLMKAPKIIDVRPRSIKKHEWIFANMVPTSITKHKMNILQCRLYFFKILVVQKILASHRYSYKRHFTMVES